MLMCLGQVLACTMQGVCKMGLKIKEAHVQDSVHVLPLGLLGMWCP